MSGAEIATNAAAAVVASAEFPDWLPYLQALTGPLIFLGSLLASCVASWAVVQANWRWKDQKKFERDNIEFEKSRASASMLIAASMEIGFIIQAISNDEFKSVADAATSNGEPVTRLYSSLIFDRIDPSSVQPHDAKYLVAIIAAHTTFRKFLAVEKSIPHMSHSQKMALPTVYANLGEALLKNEKQIQQFTNNAISKLQIDPL